VCSAQGREEGADVGDQRFGFLQCREVAAAVEVGYVSRGVGGAVPVSGAVTLFVPPTVDVLAVYVASYGFRFRVDEPASLVAHLRDLVVRLGEAVS
jgi:hypothetical protein